MRKNALKFIMATGFVFLGLVFAATTANIKDFAMDKANEAKSEELSKLYSNEGIESGFNLPLIIVDTKGKVITGEENLQGMVQVYDNDNDINYISDTPTLTSDITIKIRGNSTRAFPKKQYSLEFIKEDGKERKEAFLGMEKDSEWVLNGPFADKSLMRNYIVYKTSRNIMDYAPDVRFCEVIVIDDGSQVIKEHHYKGVYMAIERISRGNHRVNISKTQKGASETSYIVSKNSQKPGDITLNNYGFQTSLYDYGINIEYPKKDITKEKYDYISKSVSEFERNLYSDKFNDFQEGYNNYIDVDSFVDYYLINEFFNNTDAGILSTNIYKDVNEKIKAGPVWDFNSSLGNNSSSIGEPFTYEGFYMIEKSWFGRLMEDIKFVHKLEERYFQLRKTFLSDKYLLSLIDETATYLGSAVERNFYTWPMYMCNENDMFKLNSGMFREYENNPRRLDEFLKANPELLTGGKGKSLSYEEEINRMKDFVVNRGIWMDENISTLEKWAK